MKAYVYRFLDSDEEILYVGSCGDLKQQLRQHFEHGHLDESCYSNVLYVDYAEFTSRTEAYMYEQYEIAMLQPYYNISDKIFEKVDLTFLELVKTPDWKRLYTDSNYGYRWEKVYTNFSENNIGLNEPNRKYVIQEAKLLRRFKDELIHNVEILSNIDILKTKCPTYLSLIDISDIELLKSCMVKNNVHISFEYTICRERFSDTDYDSICIDGTIQKFVKQMKSLPIHEYCGLISTMNGEYEIDFPYTKKSSLAFWIPALCDTSLHEIENKAKNYVASLK